jgi:hypothetical protein
MLGRVGPKSLCLRQQSSTRADVTMHSVLIATSLQMHNVYVPLGRATSVRNDSLTLHLQSTVLDLDSAVTSLSQAARGRGMPMLPPCPSLTISVSSRPNACQAQPWQAPCYRHELIHEINAIAHPREQGQPFSPSVALQHAVHQVPQRAPEVLPARQIVLVDEEHVLLEAGVEMRLQAQLPHDRVVVAIDVGIDAVHALEDLANQSRERLGEGHACAGCQQFALIRFEKPQAGKERASPIRLGRTASLSMLLCTQLISCSI